MADGLFQGSSIYKTPAQIMAERRGKYATALSSMSGAEKAGAGIGALFSRFLPDAERDKSRAIDKLFGEVQQEFAGRPEEEKTGKAFTEMSQFEQDRSLLVDSADMYQSFSDRLAAMGYASEAESARNQALEMRLRAYDLDKANAHIEYTQAGAVSRREQAKDPFKDLPQMTGESRRQINSLIDADDELQGLFGEQGTLVGRGLQTLGSMIGLSEPPSEGIMSKQQLAQSIFALSQRENISLADAAERIKGLPALQAQQGTQPTTAESTPAETPDASAQQPVNPEIETVITEDILTRFPNLRDLGAQPGMILNRQTGTVRNP